MRVFERRGKGRRSEQGQAGAMHAHGVLTFLVVVAALSGLWAITQTEAGESEEAHTTYQLFSLPRPHGPRFFDMIVDEGGLPWVMTDTGVFYWTGTEFREPASGALTSGYYLAGFYGGPERGAYVTQNGQAPHEGLLYRLSDGAATLECTFYYDTTRAPPGLYVSSSGRIFNWGSRFLACRVDGEWNRIEANLSVERTLVFDLGEEVYFGYDKSLYRADGEGQLEERDLPEGIFVQRRHGRVVGTRWGDRRAVVFNYGQPGLSAFDLSTGRLVDLSAPLAPYRDVRFYDAFSRRTGEVWLLGKDPEEFGDVFYRLFPALGRWTGLAPPAKRSGDVGRQARLRSSS